MTSYHVLDHVVLLSLPHRPLVRELQPPLRQLSFRCLQLLVQPVDLARQYSYLKTIQTAYLRSPRISPTHWSCQSSSEWLFPSTELSPSNLIFAPITACSTDPSPAPAESFSICRYLFPITSFVLSFAVRYNHSLSTRMNTWSISFLFPSCCI